MMLFRTATAAVLAFSLWVLWAASARAADVPYVTTPQGVVDAMLKIGAVGPNDYLIDLGSGDGRIVITAAKKLGTRGMGVEIDDNLVRTARRNAEREGVKDRVEFLARNLFDTDISKATVITMYLFNSVNLRLRPSLFQLKPGTRIVSHDFDMAKWMPDDKITVEVPGKSYGPPQSDIFMWVVPTDASGRWRWQLPLGGANLEYDAAFEQTFQMIAGPVQTSGRAAQLQNARVRGDTLSFTLLTEREGRTVRQEYSGRISGNSGGNGSGDTIDGRVVTEGVQTPWRATRASRGQMMINVLHDTAPGDKLTANFLTKE